MEVISHKKRLKTKPHHIRVFLSTIHFFLPYDCYYLLVVVGFFFIPAARWTHGWHNCTPHTQSRVTGHFLQPQHVYPLLHPTGLIRHTNRPIYETRPHITEMAVVYYEIRGSCFILRESTRYPKLNAVCKLKFATDNIIIARYKIMPLKFGYLGESVYLCGKNNNYEQGIRTD